MILENFRFFDLPSIYTNNKNYTRRRILKIKYFSENKLLKQLINLIYLSTYFHFRLWCIYGTTLQRF